MPSSSLESPPPSSAPAVPSAPPSPPPPARRLGPVRIAIFAVAALLVLAWLSRFLYHVWRYEKTDDAYVSGHVHQVSARVNGTVAAVAAQENQTVQAGEILVRLDPLGFDIAAEKAEAALAGAEAAEAESRSSAAEAEAHLLQARARAIQAEAQIKQAQAQSSLAGLTLDRDSRMARDHAVTPADLDAAHASFDGSQAAVSAASANHDGIQAEIASAEDERKAAAARLQAAAASVASAQAAVKDAQREHSYIEIRAPTAGRIGNKNVEVGNRVEIGETLMAVVEPEVWIEANFKETQLARMRAGQPAEVTLDAIPGHVFPARVESIAPASGAQFALLPADNATGNFTKVVQRVPVKIVFSAGDIRGFEDRIRPGLSAVVDVKVR